MSTVNPAQGASGTQSYESASTYVEDDGYGWVLFAGTILAILATINFIEGVAAVSNSTFFVANAKFVFSSLNTWGWAMIVLSVLQAGVAFGVWARVKSVRWFGVAIAAVNAAVQLMIMPAYPFWALCMFTLDILVIYGLIVHGAKPSRR
jgi:hypothetical protein